MATGTAISEGCAVTIALTTEQQELAAAVAGFTARHAAVATTRAAFDELGAGRPQPSWQALVEQRLHAIHLPEPAGGDGAGLTELAVVLEQAAFGLFPGPLLPTVLAGQLIAEHASPPLASRLLPDLASGATAASAVTATGLRADRDGDGWRVSGLTSPVLGAASARILVLGAETGDGETVWFVVAPVPALDGGPHDKLEIVAAESVDLTRDVALVRLDDVRVSPEQVLAVEEGRVRDLAAALFAAEAAGVARWCQQTGLAYATVREQFGVPIGSFQAIRHKCARLFARTELITAAAWDAAVAHGQDGGQFALSAAAAAVIAAPAAVDLGLETVTLLGGIGYTWEHDVHLYWRRAISLAALLGPPGGWQRRLARLSAATERRHELRLDDESEKARPWAARTLAEAAALPPASQRRFLAERGLAAPHYPRPHGIAASPAAQVMIAQEFARAGLAQPSTTVGDWALPTILAHGTDEQREAFVGPTLRGEIRWCQLFSEPEPASTSRRCAPARSRRPAGGCSTGRRSGRRRHGRRTGRSAWPGPTPRRPSTRASATSWSTCAAPASRSARCARPTAATCSTRSS